MEHQGPHQPLKLLQFSGSVGLPDPTPRLFPPVPLAVALLEPSLVHSQGMTDGRQQGKELNRPAVLHRRSGEQPDRPQPRMAGQPQEGLGAGRSDRLGEVGLIGDQHRAGLRQCVGQPGPAVQLQPQPEGCRLLAPVLMEPCRGHHHQAAVGHAHQGPTGDQGAEGLAEPHRVRQHGPATGQQPAHRQALVTEQPATIGECQVGSGRRHQGPVGGQGRQGLLQPGEPSGQLRRERKAAGTLLLQRRRRLQRELPAAAAAEPLSPGTDGPQLRLGHGVERTDHFDQP